MEYFGSLFQEWIYGSVSWDYSEQSMNLGGRVSLRMALIWGVLGILFMRFVFPGLERLLDRMQGGFWRLTCALLTGFMAVNLLVSSAAVMRWRERLNQDPPSSRAEQLLDAYYGNEVMNGLYPNMVFTDR